MSANTENLISYLQMLKTCDTKIIQEVLTSNNKDGFSPIHDALISGNPENLISYLNMLKTCDSKVIQEVLTSKNIAGYLLPSSYV